MKMRSKESGYLMGIPLLLMTSGMVLAFILPILPEFAGKVCLIVFAVPILAGLYYMIVVPGWQPGQKKPDKRNRMIRFACSAVLVIIFVSGYILFT